MDAQVTNQALNHLLLSGGIDPWLDGVRSAEYLSQRKNPSGSGFIYLACDARNVDSNGVVPVKIGKTRDPLARLESYKTYSPDGFVFERVWSVVDYHAAERFILKHKAIKPFRSKKSGGGTEWFNLSIKHAVSLIENAIDEFRQKEGVFFLPESQQKGFGK